MNYWLKSYVSYLESQIINTERSILDSPDDQLEGMKKAYEDAHTEILKFIRMEADLAQSYLESKLYNPVQLKLDVPPHRVTELS